MPEIPTVPLAGWVTTLSCRASPSASVADRAIFTGVPAEVVADRSLVTGALFELRDSLPGPLWQV